MNTDANNLYPIHESTFGIGYDSQRTSRNGAIVDRAMYNGLPLDLLYIAVWYGISISRRFPLASRVVWFK